MENQVKYYYGTQAAYDLLVQSDSVDASGMYVITDRQALYRGQTLIASHDVRCVAEMPNPQNAVAGVLYVVENAGGTTLAVLNKTGDSMHTLVNTQKINVVSDNVTLSSEITLSLAGQSLGGISDGHRFPAGTTLTTILNALMRKEIPAAVASQPALSLTINPSAAVECGTTITPTVTPKFTPGSYKFGPDTGVRCTKYILQETSTDASAPVERTNGEQPTAYKATEAVTVPEGTLTYNATVTHTEGAAANSSFGTPNNEVKIAAGNKAASLAVTGQRMLFYVADTQENKVTDSAGVRGLASKKLNPQNGTTFDIALPEGARRVIIAYPKKLRAVTDIKQMSTNMSAKGSFTETEIQVEGANKYKPCAYRVYTYVSAAPMNADTFKVTI